MYPEAGGSSSFARHAFNEFWSFFAAWGQMLNYIITVSISAFFVPHYLGVFWEPLRHSPGRHHRAASSWSGCSARSTSSASRRRPGSTSSWRVVDFATQLRARGPRLRPRALARHAGEQRPPRQCADAGRDFLIAIPVGMVAYTGIETISNMAEEARTTAKTIPRVDRRRGRRRDRDLRAACPRSRCRRCRSRTATTRSASRGPGGYAGDPILGVVKNIDLGSLQQPAEIYVGILAATILFIATNAGLIGVSRLTYSMGQHRQLPEQLRTAAPEVPHAVHRDHRLRRDRVPDDPAGQGRLPRQDLRVRRDALVHDRAPVRDRAADEGARPRAALPRARASDDPRPRRCRCSPSSAALGTGHRLGRRHGANVYDARSSASVWLAARDRHVRRSTAAAWACR